MPNAPEPASGLAAGETLRRITLGEHLIDYRLRRARRRTIGLSIDHRGLSVGAPLRASLGEIEGLLHRHADWIARKLGEWRAGPQPCALAVHDGTRLPFLGTTLTIRLEPGNNRVVWSAPDTDGPTLTLCLRQPAAAPRLLEAALREHVRSLFENRLSFFCTRLGLPVPPLALSAARTRWGSCSRQGGIRLNWRLVHFAPQLIDYVVAHEVAHLLEMNHGPRFWAVVARLYPEYGTARRALREAAASCPAGFAAAP